MHLVFLGAAEFAVPGLERLLASHHQIRGVITHPDRPRGRGLQPQPTPVKKVALLHKVPVLTPENLDDERLQGQLRDMQPELLVVVAFRFLPEALYSIAPKGAINLHASLLPKYRGAAPIQWALMNGESLTGVTTFFINPRLDQGDLLLQREVPILPEDNAGSLSARLAKVGSELLLETINQIETNMITARQQNHSQATRAPKLTKEICQINWNKSAIQIHNLIRALAPQPCAFTFFRGNRLKVFRSLYDDSHATVRDDRLNQSQATPGTILTSEPKTGLAVATGSGIVLLNQVQPEGKSIISGAEFISGYHPRIGEKLG